MAIAAAIRLHTPMDHQLYAHAVGRLSRQAAAHGPGVLARDAQRLAAVQNALAAACGRTPRHKLCLWYGVRGLAQRTVVSVYGYTPRVTADADDPMPEVI